MNKLYEMMGVKFSRKLRWYDYAVITWISLSFCLLSFDADSTPITAVLLIVANFAASLWVGKQVLPDVYDLDDEESAGE